MAAPRRQTCAGTCLSPAKGLPWRPADPFPRTRSCRNTDAFSAGGAGSPSRRPLVPLPGDGAAGRAETPEHPPGNRALSPQPRACRGEQDTCTAMCRGCPRPGEPSGRRAGADMAGRARGGPSKEAAWVRRGTAVSAAVPSCGKGSGAMCHAASAATFPVSQGGCRRLGPPAGTRSPPQHFPSVQCPKEAKETSGGGGMAAALLSGLSLLGPSSRGSSSPCSSLQAIPRARRCPGLSSARGGGGVVALSSHPKPTVNPPIKDNSFTPGPLHCQRGEGGCSSRLSPLSPQAWGCSGGREQLSNLGGKGGNFSGPWRGATAVAGGCSMAGVAGLWGGLVSAELCPGVPERGTRSLQALARGKPGPPRPCPRGFVPGDRGMPARRPRGPPALEDRAEPPSPSCPAALVCISPPPLPISQSGAAVDGNRPMTAPAAHLLAPATGAPSGRG